MSIIFDEKIQVNILRKSYDDAIDKDDLPKVLEVGVKLKLNIKELMNKVSAMDFGDYWEPLKEKMIETYALEIGYYDAIEKEGDPESALNVFQKSEQELYDLTNKMVVVLSSNVSL